MNITNAIIKLTGDDILGIFQDFINSFEKIGLFVMNPLFSVENGELKAQADYNLKVLSGTLSIGLKDFSINDNILTATYKFYKKGIAAPVIDLWRGFISRNSEYIKVKKDSFDLDINHIFQQLLKLDFLDFKISNLNIEDSHLVINFSNINLNLVKIINTSKEKKRRLKQLYKDIQELIDSEFADQINSDELN